MRKMNKILSLILAVLLAVSVMSFAAAGEEEETDGKILPAEYVDFHTDSQAAYMADTVWSYGAYALGATDVSQPNPVVCDIAGDGIPVQNKYWFQKADNPGFENATTVQITNVKNGKYYLYNTKAGEHFYWRAAEELENIEESPIHDVYITTEYWRNIFAYGIANLRDIGGWPSSLGEDAYVRQGLFFRGGNPEMVLKKGEEQMEALGIRREIDLRDDIGKEGPYFNEEIIEYHNFKLSSSSPEFFDGYKEEYKGIYELIAEADEYPVYLHCVAGADRTGLASFMLLTVCGVSFEDATRDYLLTNYANYGDRDLDAPARWYSNLSEYEGETLAEQAKSWLVSKGVAPETVEKLRRAFVENYDPEYKGYSLEPSSWAKEEVEECIRINLVPHQLREAYDLPITRGQVSRMIVNLLEKASWKTADMLVKAAGKEIDSDTFTDTKDSAILAANALGIIKGVGDDRFNVNGLLTRAQMAALINRVANALGVDTTGFTHDFTDITGSSAWAYDELGWPVQMGIIKGVGGTRFAPGNPLTREQAMLIVYRAFDVLKSGKYRAQETELETPAKSGGKTLTGYFDSEDILAYLTLDSDTQYDLGDIKAVLSGSTNATTGYYSEGVNVKGGYISLEGFDPDAESFTVAMMVRIHGKEDDDPSIIGNKDWENGINPGFVLSFRGKDVKFNLGDGENRMDETWDVPTDYTEGWMHVILVVDRKNETVGVSIDFGGLDTRDFEETLKGVSFKGTGGVNVGQDGTGSYHYGFNSDVDDIVIFNKALSDSEIAKLAAYYGIAS